MSVLRAEVLWGQYWTDGAIYTVVFRGVCRSGLYFQRLDRGICEGVGTGGLGTRAWDEAFRGVLVLG